MNASELLRGGLVYKAVIGKKYARWYKAQPTQVVGFDSPIVSGQLDYLLLDLIVVNPSQVTAMSNAPTIPIKGK